MRTPEYVVKIGGSVITRKDVKHFPLTIDEIIQKSLRYYRHDIASELVAELYRASQKSNFRMRQLSNGAGPFGHYLITHWQEHRNVDLIHESVKHLHKLFAKDCLERGFILHPIAPYDTCVYMGEGKFNMRKMWREANKIPLEEIFSTYGDITKPAKNVKGHHCDGKVSVLSADNLSLEYAAKIKPTKVIMVTDVDGVYTDDPKNNLDAKLEPVINSRDYAKAYASQRSGDVTGAMLGKLEKAILLARNYGTNTQIINGLVRGRFYKALMGQEVKGTLVLS